MPDDKKPTEEDKRHAKAVVDEVLNRFDVAIGRGIRSRVITILVIIGAYLIYTVSGFKWPHV